MTCDVTYTCALFASGVLVVEAAESVDGPRQRVAVAMGAHAADRLVNVTSAVLTGPFGVAISSA